MALFVMGLDLVTLSLLAWFSAYGLTAQADFNPIPTAALSILLAVAMISVLAGTGGYALRSLSRLGSQARRLAILIAFGLAAWFVAIGTLGHSPLSLGGVAFLFFATCLFFRWSLVVPAIRWAIDAGLNERRAVLIGGGDPARDLIDGLRKRTGNDIRICAVFDDRSGDRSPDLVLDVPKIGRFDDLLTFARNAEIDLVIIALPLEATDRIAMLMDKFKVLPLPLQLAQYSKDYAFDHAVPAPSQAKFSLLARESFGARRRITKRLFDLVISTLAVILLTPVFLLVALAIRLDSSGPVFFRQLRSGFNERAVPVLKFRTMKTAQCDAAAQNIVTKGDPRVTRVGAFLRKSSLDELPQLFNVLRGELSLVGPRPHAIDAVTGKKEAFSDLVAGYSARHRLPPGITGWAQIHGWRGGIEDPQALHQRVSYDLWYIENWSLWLDLRILAATPFALLNTNNAY
ncbi:MAG: exopolysaccharide biosynthesis polyprenyl glycosylphosphotransferase [Pseudomonadota bacterium]